MVAGVDSDVAILTNMHSHTHTYLAEHNIIILSWFG